MCHIANAVFACGCKTMWRLHCERRNAGLCTGPDLAVVSLYRYRGSCRACLVYAIRCEEDQAEREHEQRVDAMLGRGLRVEAYAAHLAAIRAARGRERARARQRRAEGLDAILLGMEWAREHSKAVWNLCCVGDEEDEAKLAQMMSLEIPRIEALPVRSELRGGPESPFHRLELLHMGTGEGSEEGMEEGGGNEMVGDQGSDGDGGGTDDESDDDDLNDMAKAGRGDTMDMDNAQGRPRRPPDGIGIRPKRTDGPRKTPESKISKDVTNVDPLLLRDSQEAVVAIGERGNPGMATVPKPLR